MITGNAGDDVINGGGGIAYLRRIEAGMSVTWETSVCVNPLSARGPALRIRPGGESITFIRTTIDMSTSAC